MARMPYPSTTVQTFSSKVYYASVLQYYFRYSVCQGRSKTELDTIVRQLITAQPLHWQTKKT